MGLVRLGRMLWRRRVAVSIGALLALVLAVIGIVGGGGGAASTSAESKVLINTPKSLIADARAPGALTIYTRARLVAELIAGDEARDAIARRAGLRPSELAIAGPGAAAPPLVITALAEQAVEVAKPTDEYLVSVEVSPQQPIISIVAHAPERAAALRLGRAALATLPEVADGAPGAGDAVAIEPLGEPLVATRTAAGGKKKAVGVALALFVLWCAGCVVLDAIGRRRGGRRRWRPVEGALR